MRNRFFVYAVLIIIAVGSSVATFELQLKRRALTPVGVVQTKSFSWFVQPFEPSVQLLVQRIIANQNSAFWENLEALYDYVATYINYKSDEEVWNKPDYWQTPAESLRLKTGDCEDQAILLCSLLLAWKPDLPASCITIFGETTGFGHCAVIIAFGDQICILDPAGGWFTSDANVTILKNGVVRIGGTGKITKQPAETELENWLKYWELSGMQNARITCTFNYHDQRQYDTNREFLTWIATGGGN